MKNRLILFLTCSLLVISIAHSQKCLTNEKRMDLVGSTLALNEILERNEIEIQKWIKENNHGAIRSSVTIPVVVHVLWRVNAENISDEQIFSQIDVLNLDFRKLNTNFNSTPIPFQNVAADVEIEFCLASTDPSGKPTTGITRTKTSIDDIGLTEAYYKTNQGGENSWDVKKYINIWVCDLGDDGDLGFAYPPGFADPIESDGMVIGFQYFGTKGAAANSAPNHLGRTATHEMGHYFNLEHVWGPGEGGCYEDDFVSDTPNQDVATEGCPAFPFIDYCTETGNGIMYGNYLDYSDDNCMSFFTNGQKDRMLAALNGPRKSLLASDGCNTMTALNDFKNESIITIYPNPVSQNFIIQSNSSQFADYILYDIYGKTVLQINGYSNERIDVSHISEGIYYLYAKNNNGIFQKLIISK